MTTQDASTRTTPESSGRRRRRNDLVFLRRLTLTAALLSCPIQGPGPLAAQTPPELEILPRTHQAVDLSLAGGQLVGGHHGGEHGSCGGANRAFLALLDNTGQEVWQLAQAPLGAVCGDPLAPSLFDGFAGLDPGHVVSSRLSAAVVTAEDDVIAVGDLRLAWLSAADGTLTASTVAFLGRWTAAGILLRGQLVGTLPDGPPPGGVGCEMICDMAQEGGDGFAARTLVLGPDGVTVAGWQRPTVSGQSPRARDLWVSRLDPTLETVAWTYLGGTLADDEALQVVVDSTGRTLIAGTGQDDPLRLDQQMTLTRIAADGTLDRRIVFGGPFDDIPQSLVLEANGEVVFGALFADQITLGGQTLGVPGAKKQGLTARLDPDLGWISAQVVSPPGQGGGQALSPRRFAGPPQRGLAQRSGDNHPAIPMAYQVVSGSEQRGQLEQLAASDDDYLRIVADSLDIIELRVLFDPDPMDRMTLYLGAVRVELASLFCYHARILVKGMISEDFLVAGEEDFCPSDEPILEIQIPEDFSSQLGYDGSTIIDPQHRLVVAVQLEFQPGPPAKATSDKGMAYAGAEEDSSVDHIEVIVEY